MTDHNGKSRANLEKQANEVRAKLLHTVEQLDQKRHETLDLRVQLDRHLRQLVIFGVVALACTAAVAALVVQRVASAAERRRRMRWSLAKGVWRHPERAMRVQRRRSFFYGLVRAVLLAIATTAITFPARREVRRTLS